MVRLGFLLAGLLATATAALAERPDPAIWGRPSAIPFPDDAPWDPRIATLGKMLFFDPRLSGAQNMSCASCHNPSFGWETPVDRAVGAANLPLGRHAPTTLNQAWSTSFFWDGRAASLEDQARGPITAPAEMNAQFPEVIARLSEVPEYAEWFNLLFPGQGISEATILRSIATFERTIVSGVSPFDRWVGGDETALSAEAKRGFALFVGKAGCSACHVGWNMTDDAFHDIGLSTADDGRAAVTGDLAEQHAFKTPGLRNIALRAPYMHNGSLQTLDEVIRHYASGGIERPSRSAAMVPFETDDQDVAALVAFLASLTEEETRIPTPILPAN